MPLDNLALQYIETQAETDFNALYNEFSRAYSGKYPIIANQFNGDVHAVQAAFEDTLLKALGSFKPCKGVFNHYLKRALRNTRTDLCRTYNRQRAEITVSPINSGNPEERNIFYMLSDENDVEAEVINQLTDQTFRKSLYRQVPSEDRKTIEALQIIENGATIHKAAQQLGMCHKTVKRRLQKILGKAV